MLNKNILDILGENPVVAAVKESKLEKAIASPSDVIFLLGGSILNIRNDIDIVHRANKLLFVHIDLTEGIGKDKTGIEFLAKCGVDGIVSTRVNMIKYAKDCRLYAVQRFFALDTQGLNSISDMLSNNSPDFIEIMPGVIEKVIERFSSCGIPLIAGGLIETKREVTTALNYGAFAVSTGKEELWYI
ncbi:MAG: glycerol-3-phosphate responsive antiterminator [Clostridia bacterium]|nr:glycerol-3-phosphate responsive antiterminator [Clostridia bacterium]